MINELPYPRTANVTEECHAKKRFRVRGGGGGGGSVVEAVVQNIVVVKK